MSKLQQQALYDILNSNRLDVAKELAAEALGIDVEEYLTRDRELELEFDNLEEDGFYDELNFEEFD